MGLEELNEKLHGRDAHLERVRTSEFFDPGHGTNDPKIATQFTTTETWVAPKETQPASLPELALSNILSKKRRRYILWILGSIAILLLLGGLIFKVRGMLFNEERVGILITGPQNVASAEETTFTVTYTNDNWAGLNNAILIFSYPESFHPAGGKTEQTRGSFIEIPLGTIKANAQAKQTITGKFYGSRGDLAYLKATLRYTPKSVATIFEKTISLGVNVASSPLSLEITAPPDIVSGQDAEYVIDYSNASDMRFSNLRVQLEYPSGFQFVSAEPRASEGDAVWYIGNLNARAEGKIIVRGVLSGQNEEYKHIKGKIGFFQGDGTFLVYAENERQTRITASPFLIVQTVNGFTNATVDPGATLRYAIHYENESSIGMRDVIVTLEIDPTLLDMSRLTLTKGAYDAARRVMVWKASYIPSLSRVEPGESGDITFSVPVRDNVSSVDGKNLSIKSIAKIDSPDIPTTIGANKIIGSNTLLIKLNSLVGMDVRALYEDTIFPNTGPIPPQVGQETTYTFHVNVTNSSNDLKQVRLSLLLPTGVRYTGKFSPSTETATFNERTNELVWELGTVTGAVGVARELVFQIAVVPSPNNANASIVLMNSATLTGRDMFTNQDIRIDTSKVQSPL